MHFPPFSTSGWLWGHHPKQLLWQAGAALTVIVWDGVMTFVILKVLGLFVKLRLPETDDDHRRVLAVVKFLGAL